MPLSAILATVAAYLLIVALLVSVGFASRWRWWVKGAALVVTGLLFAGTYVAITAMLGWPTTSDPPQRYALLWSKVIEPDKFTGDAGRIYVWTRRLNADGVAETTPRSYQFAYSEALVHELDVAQQQRSDGEDVLVDSDVLAEAIARAQAGDAEPSAQNAEAGPEAPALTSGGQLRAANLSLPLLIITIGAYVVIAVLLVSLNLTSRWRWWIKGTGIVVTTAFFIGAYFAVNSLLGWPTRGTLPNRFALLWTEVVKPEDAPGGNGAVYMWVEALDENNVPSDFPRAYTLPYTEPLADDAEDAQEQRQEGEDVMGQVQEMSEEEMLELENKNKQMSPENENAELNAAADTVPFMEQDLRINFQELPPIVLPDKGPL